MSIFITIIGLLIVSIISSKLTGLFQNNNERIDIIKEGGEKTLDFNNISLEEEKK